jgi:hypothetical protein
MNKAKYLLLAFTLIIYGFSCDEEDLTSPIVMITSPSDSTSFSISDTIKLEGTITDNFGLRFIRITSDFGFSEEITAMDFSNSHTLNNEITFDPSTSDGSYILTVTATDEFGNRGTDEVQIILE